MLEKAARPSSLSETVRTRKACGVARLSNVLHTRRQKRRPSWSWLSESSSKIKPMTSRGKMQEDRDAIRAEANVKAKEIFDTTSMMGGI